MGHFLHGVVPEAHLTLHGYMYLMYQRVLYLSLVLWDEDGSETGSRACRLTATARERGGGAQR